MEYQKFLEKLLSQVKSLIGEQSVVSINRIQKNNGVLLDGLIIQDGDRKISPAIYMEAYYKQYQKGRKLLDIADEIYQIFLRYNKMEEPDIKTFLDFEFVRERIIYKLVNFEKNKNMLQEVPHILFLDLALVFYVMIDWKECENASFLIRNEHLELWKTTKEDVYEYAKRNTRMILPPVMKRMEDILGELTDDEIWKHEDMKEVIPMYVLTNKKSYMGAASICYEDVLLEFAAKLETDLYIIPSSIHEVILIPAFESVDISEMEKTICEVNLTQLMPEDVLSNHLYYYDCKKDSVRILGA